MNVKEVYDYQFLSPFKKCIPTKIPCQTISVSEIEYIFFNQRKEMFVKVAYQFLSTFIKMYPDKYFSAIKVSAFEMEYTFFNQRKEMYVEEDYQFLSHLKKCIPTSTSMTKSFSV